MPAKIDDTPERNGVYLLTIARSASNLFQTMNAKQPGYQCSGYKLWDAGFDTIEQFAAKGRWSEWPEADRTAVTEKFRKCFDDLLDEIADAKRNGKQVFIKEHTKYLYSPEQLSAFLLGDDEAQPQPLHLHVRNDPVSTTHTNPSSLPDRFLLSLQPIFQIRHPALAFPSRLRAFMDIVADGGTHNPRTRVSLNFKHSRAMYDWYAQNAGSTMQPRVIDADDVINSPDVVRQLCVETGLDPDAIQYKWEVRHSDDPNVARMLSTINASTGIIKGLDASNLDIEAEEGKWKAEFGEDEGERLAGFVRDAMPDYEYLLSKRTRA